MFPINSTENPSVVPIESSQKFCRVSLITYDAAHWWYFRVTNDAHHINSIDKYDRRVSQTPKQTRQRNYIEERRQTTTKKKKNETVRAVCTRSPIYRTDRWFKNKIVVDRKHSTAVDYTRRHKHTHNTAHSLRVGARLLDVSNCPDIVSTNQQMHRGLAMNWI